MYFKCLKGKLTSPVSVKYYCRKSTEDEFPDQHSLQSVLIIKQGRANIGLQCLYICKYIISLDYVMF